MLSFIHHSAYIRPIKWLLFSPSNRVNGWMKYSSDKRCCKQQPTLKYNKEMRVSERKTYMVVQHNDRSVIRNLPVLGKENGWLPNTAAAYDWCRESEKQAKQWPMAKQQSNTQRKTQGIHKSEQVYIQPWDWHMNALQQDWSAAAGGHLIMNATSSHLWRKKCAMSDVDLNASFARLPSLQRRLLSKIVSFSCVLGYSRWHSLNKDLKRGEHAENRSDVIKPENFCSLMCF